MPTRDDGPAAGACCGSGAGDATRAQERAQVGVVPGLDAPVRQAELAEGLARRGALGRKTRLRPVE